MENVNRIRILQVARDLFNARGYRSVTVQELAEKLGISKKTIYQYFTSKEEIATAVVEETMESLDEIQVQFINMAKESQSDPLFLIKEILIHAKNESMRFGPLFKMDMEKYLPDLANKFKQFRIESKQNIERLLQRAQEIGLLKDIPINLAMEILSVCLKAIVQLENRDRFSTEDALDLFLDIFCNGIANQALIKKNM
jgi:AcrR family transcriptional regulator